MASRALVAPLAAAILFLLAPTAAAQAPSLPDPTAVLEDLGATAGSTAEDTVGTVTDTVTEVAADPTAVLPDEVEDTVDQVTQPAEGPVKKILDTVDQTVPGVVGVIPDELLGDGHNDGTGTGIDGSGSLRPGKKGHAPGDRVRGARAATDTSIFGGVELATESRARTPAPTVTPVAEEPSLFSQALEIAVKGLVRIAFPLVLAALVAVFLALQGRIGRKDPKLALAPLDPRQTTLTFR